MISKGNYDTRIDIKKLNRMKLAILELEKNNLNMRKKRDEVINEIQRIIVDEVNKNY